MRSGASPFVGRDVPLAAMRRAIERADAGESSVLLVAGPAGVGKTRLLRECRREWPGLQFLIGGAAAIEGEDLSYGPILAALRRAEVAWPPDDAVAGATGRLRVLEALLEALDGLGRAATTVLALEDLHWADASTRSALDYVARNLTSERVVVVGTYRDDALPRAHPLRHALAELVRLDRVEVVPLEPLGIGETRTLVAHQFGGDVDEAVVSSIHARGHGIPFFTEELARAAAVGEQTLPHTLSAVLEAQISGLPTEVLTIVRLVALVGQGIPPETVATLTGVGDAVVGDALRAAIDAGFLVVDDDGVVFRHSLQREAVEATLLPSERRALHASIASHFEEAGVASTTNAVARHWYLAGDAVRAHAAAVRAAEVAEAASDLLGALNQLELALETWPADDAENHADPVDVLLRAAGLALDAGEGDRAVTLARRAAARTDLRTDVDRAVRGAGVLADALGATLEYGEAWQVVKAALGPAERCDPVAAAAFLTSAVRVASVTGRARAARSLAERALDAARRSGSRVLEARALGAAGVAAVTVGALGEGFELLERSEQVAREERESRVAFTARLDHVHVLYFLGRHRRCVELGLGAIEDARQLGLARSLTPAFSGLAALAALHDDRPQVAARSLTGQGREATGLGGVLLGLARARVAVVDGDVDRCRAGLERVLDTGGAGLGIYAADWGAIRIECALLEPDPVPGLLDALSVVQRAADLSLLGTGWWLAARVAAVRWLGTSDDPVLGEACDEIVALVERAGASPGFEAPTPAADAWRTVARALAGSAPDDGWVAARERCVTAEVAAETAWLDLAEAAALLARGQREQAAPLLERLLARTDPSVPHRLGADLAARARVAPSTVEQRPAAAAYDLTARELDVIRLVAEGMTNREIAERLFISPKTASVHLSNLMRKLGVDDRRAAAAVARRLGLLAPSS